MFNIPDSRSVGQGLLQGFETGSNHMARLLQQKIQQQQLAQQQEHFLQNFGINQSRENRLTEEHPYKIKALELEQELGPEKLKHLQAKIAHENAKTEQALKGPDPLTQMRKQQLINSHEWNSMTPSVKENVIALGNGLGIRPDVLIKGMTQGKTFQDIAQEHGYKPKDIENVTSKYLATSGNVKLENERQKKVAELNVIEDHVTEALAPYIGTIGGYSMLQTIDALKGESPDKQARYFAARALQPELAAIRINVMGGNVGQGAIEEMVHSALGSSKVIQGLVKPEVYKKMQHYITEWLKEGSAAATESIYGRGGSTKNRSFSIEELSDEQLEAMRNG